MSCLRRERRLLIPGTTLSTSPRGLSSSDDEGGDEEGDDDDGLDFLFEQVRLGRGGDMDEESEGWDGELLDG